MEIYTVKITVIKPTSGDYRSYKKAIFECAIIEGDIFNFRMGKTYIAKFDFLNTICRAGWRKRIWAKNDILYCRA